MSHNSFARRPPLWVDPSVPTARDMSIWDAAQYKSLDGVNGGLWTPKKPIVIGGAGLILNGAGNFMIDGVSTSRGGRVRHGDNDYVELSPAFTRTETIGLTTALADLDGSGIGGTGLLPCVVSLSPRGISPIAQDFVVPIPSRYLHQGATLTQAKLLCRALVRHGSAPVTGPYWMIANIVSMNAAVTGSDPLVPVFSAWALGTIYALNSVVIPNNASIAQTGFYYVATAVSGTGTSGATPPAWPTVIGTTVIDNAGANQITWKCEGYAGVLPDANAGVGNTYSGGLVQSSLMSAPTATPFVIDCTTYDYALQVSYDSFGPGTAASPNWLFHSLQLSYGNVVDMRPE